MLNQDGINKLEAIMLANGEYFYNQRTFGTIHYDADHACKTELCAAGFARLLEIGKDGYFKEASGHRFTFPEDCENSGIRLLGLHAVSTKDSNALPIFGMPSEWPHDLYVAYSDAETDKERIAVYINMLRTRVNDDGTIRRLKEVAA